MSTPLLHEAFLAHAARTPDAPALLWRGDTVTYGTLERRSADLARRIAAANLGPDGLVGVCVSRGPALATALLAVMRAGAAWVPLDPAYPQDRLEYMLHDSGVRLVVADGVSAARLPDGVRLLDPDGPVPVGTPPADTLPARTPGDLAYVIYTSGSTGRPKGVLVEHGTVAATVAGMRTEWGVTAADRVLQFAPSSFDASVCEHGIALTAGAALVLADADSVVPGPGLVDLLARSGTAVAVLPPSVVAALPDTPLPALRTLVCAGEALPAEVAARWGRGRRMINAYGPTETSICVTTGDVTGPGAPDIGHELPGVYVDLLDPAGRPVPSGEVGEMIVSGAGVTRGYLGRPALTAERFVPVAGGRRAYRTGDLARLLPDGRIAYVGRVDHQVKVRGFRVEPGEIAEVLRAHPAVADAVVVPRDGILVGYVAAPDAPADPLELRAWCARTLPAHMIPAAVVVLTALPLTPSGKVDREALPRHGRASAGLAGDREEPATAAEQTVAALMSELLGGADVGATDDFFQLGGHSLLVGRLAARLRDDMGVYISLDDLFHDATPRAVAALAEANSTPNTARSTALAPPPLRPADRTRPLPLSYPQERIWFLEQISPLNPAYRVQAALHLTGALDLAALRAALTELVRRHEIFRTAFREVDGAPAQCPVDMTDIDVDVPLVDLSELSESAREDAWRDLVAREKDRPFHLDRPPLVRWVIARTAPDAHRLLHLEHHLVHDGWSFAVFIDELTRLYAVFAEGAPALPEPDLQFADLAAWQRGWLIGPVLDRYLDHWRAALAGAPAALELPTDRPRPPEFTFRGDVVRFEFAPDEYALLRSRAREAGVTLYSLMLTAFAALMSRYSDQDDFVLGVGVANRRLTEAEPLIGMMVNTVPLRVRLDGDPTFRALLNRVHATAVEGYVWQDIPLQSLVKDLVPVRDLSRNPLFSALFSFHDSAVPDLDFAGLRGHVSVEHNGSAKADLNVVVIPRAEQRASLGPSGEDDSITVLWEYATDLFDTATMRRMAQAYQDLLRAALDDPDRPVSRLPLSSAAPDASAAPAIGPGVLEQVEYHLAQRPCDPALTIGAHTLTYGDLGVRADALVHRLTVAGAGPGRTVAVRLPAGADLVVSLLAAARTGAVCSVLDADEEPDAAAVLVTAALHGDPVRVTPALEADGKEPDSSSRRRRSEPSSEADTLAVADGVEVTLGALRSALAALDALRHGPGQVLQAAAVTSSLFLVELWTTLARGGTLVVPETPVESATDLAALLRARVAPFTALILPDTIATSLLAHHDGAVAEGTEALLVHGSNTDPSALSAAAGVCRLATGWGTPALPLAFTRAHPPKAARDALVVPVGAPAPGVTALVLDAHGNSVPLGVPGELHLTHGESGPPRPTGQRARRTPAGEFEVLGPVGAWPMVSGFRVVPQETRARLTAHRAIAEATVLTADGELQAYLVPRTGDRVPDDGDLVEFLAGWLPDYQIPKRFIPVRALPPSPARVSR
ncbi:amino acid adenylation domain-containing protein [Streptomyces sp. NBC_01637]|uniref:amino acid adenylation domain-containing protein n=1 Tax=unclassified Streptomyces TaxID=2593676 RepID=UPI00386F1373|nr:amino acid adenylation domain-containing protein [Streptomyces sp. NBC_01653]WTC84570.1 amino acid adenylation domain-containing protein [Streptomyces sp. NBC_01653]WTD86297.1 amino acid adenylation domain-containing protein [Streptomyces sp. NBC_01637]WTD94227.1 amino acid adenylation domain-containing protein [Streptomyces sp. NBC_01637]